MNYEYSNCLISIIIPMYNSENHIVETLKSALNQSYKNIEIIVVNDGSTDNSEDLVLELMRKNERLKYISQKNSGASMARNNGIKNAEGDYVLFFDADDILLPNAIWHLVHNKDNEDNEQYDLIIGNYSSEDTFGNIIENSLQEQLREEIRRSGPVVDFISLLDPLPGNKLIRKKFIDNNRVSYSSLRIGQDLNFYLKLLSFQPLVKVIADPIFNYKIHEGSLSSTYTDSITDIIKSLNEVAIQCSEYYNEYPEILESLKYKHFSLQLYKVPRIKNKKVRRQVYKKLYDASIVIEKDKVNKTYLGVDTFRINLVLKNRRMFTSEWFSKVVLIKNNIKKSSFKMSSLLS